MSGNTTVYDVKVRYAMSGNAKQGLSEVAKSADKAAGSAMSLRGALAAIGGGLIFAKAKSALIDFNSEIEQLKIGMSTIMQLQLKMPLAAANKEADKLFYTFQELAKKSPATTKDFMEMAAAIAAPIALLGGGPDKLAAMTQGAVITAQAFGERADMVALDVKQMLMGTVSLRDRVAQQLLASKGMDHLEFNKMEGKDRARITEELLQSQPLKNAADAMGASFAGQVSTFKDQIQIALAQVGVPLMKEMGKEVARWNTWIEKHPKTIAKIGSELSGMLTGAFTFIRDAAGWLVDNRETLFTIGKFFLIFKGAQMAGNVIGNFVTSLTSMASKMTSVGNSLLNASGSLSSAFSSLGAFLVGPGGLIAGLTAAGAAIAFMVEDQKRRDQEDADRRALGMQIGQILKPTSDKTEWIAELKDRNKNASPDMRDANNQKIIDSYAGADAARYGATLRALAVKTDEVNGDLAYGKGYADSIDMDMIRKGLLSMMPDTFAGSATDVLNQKKAYSDFTEFLRTAPAEFQQAVLEAAFPERFGKPDLAPPDMANQSQWVNAPGKSEVNVTINKIEVASDDPDRFVHGLVTTAEQIANNPTQAQSVIGGGF